MQQATEGKGNERHATGERFQDQKIMVIARWLGKSVAGGPLFQAAKKIFEAATLEQLYPTTGVDRAIHELRGAINYLAAAILLLEEHDVQVCVTTEWNVQRIPVQHECSGTCKNCQCKKEDPSGYFTCTQEELDEILELAEMKG